MPGLGELVEGVVFDFPAAMADLPDGFATVRGKDLIDDPTPILLLGHPLSLTSNLLHLLKGLMAPYHSDLCFGAVTEIQVLDFPQLDPALLVFELFEGFRATGQRFGFLPNVIFLALEHDDQAPAPLGDLIEHRAFGIPSIQDHDIEKPWPVALSGPGE